MSENKIIGMDGLPIDSDEPVLVDPSGMPVTSEEPERLHPVVELQQREQAAVDKFERYANKPVMSRGDLKSAVNALGDIAECMKGYLLMVMNDMMASQMQEKEHQAYSMLLETRIVALTDLLVEGGVLTTEQIQKKWEEMHEEIEKEGKEESAAEETTPEPAV